MCLLNIPSYYFGLFALLLLSEGRWLGHLRAVTALSQGTIQPSIFSMRMKK